MSSQEDREMKGQMYAKELSLELSAVILKTVQKLEANNSDVPVVNDRVAIILQGLATTSATFMASLIPNLTDPTEVDTFLEGFILLTKATFKPLKNMLKANK